MERGRGRDGERERGKGGEGDEKTGLAAHRNMIRDLHQHLHSEYGKNIILQMSKATDWITPFSKYGHSP